MPKGLSVSDVVNVTVNLSPLAAQYRNFGATLIVGDSNVIDTNERIRQYSQLEQVVEDFGTTTSEYLAADLFFSQSPQNALLYIGRWARVDTAAQLHGDILTPNEQLLSVYTPITAGSFHVVINTVAADVTGIDLHTQTNLNGVASVIQTAVRAADASAGFTAATVKWDSIQERFTLTSGTTGASSTIGYATAAGSGTSLAGILGFDNTVDTPVPVQGIVAETAVACAAVLADMTGDWYCLIFAASVQPGDSDYIAVSALIEGQGQSRIHGITTQETGSLDHTNNSVLASSLKSLGYQRTFIQYSSSSPYAIASLWARQSTVNFEANNTTLTLKFKQEPGVVAEFITETMAQSLRAKHCNVFVNYQNDTAIIQEGVMSGGFFIDERVGADWFQNRIQNDVYNLLYQEPTKIPQTDAGTHLIVNVINKSCDAAVNNGWVAPGQWNVRGFGQLNQGDTLTLGYYVFAPLVATQPQADREARKAVPIQVAAKLAGAVHHVDVICTVNR